MFKNFADFLFDPREPRVLSPLGLDPDPDLAARNAARIAAAKEILGDKYILAQPINAPIDINALNPELLTHE